MLTLSVGQHLCEIVKMGHFMHIKEQLIALLLQLIHQPELEFNILKSLMGKRLRVEPRIHNAL